jgi:membrane-bound lytic murein transglycosylase A
LALFVAPENDAARTFFEHAFTPFSVQEDGEANGLFTGYYVPVLQGRSTADADFDVPLLARPDDLVSVDLGNFMTALSGQKIYGRVVDGRLAPYFSRADIETGAWSQTPQPLVWLQDPVDAFFLHIQGSGVVQLEDGRTERLGFAGKNGLPYTSVGRYLIRENLLGKHEASMQGIRAWVAANPDARQSVLHQNDSYVFFEKQQANGAIGALNVALTPTRSLAVDRRHIPLGAPLWLSIDAPANQDVSNRLMIAQDTGGAIKGAVRGDFYWGEGDEAGARAGRMKQQGRYFILLPKDLANKVARP